MSEIITVGLDLAKNVFQAHGADACGRAVLRKKLRRDQVLPFFSQLPPCVVAMEACGGAHFWGREIGKLGHEVRLIPPAYVKPFVKRQKNDAADAEAICEAATRPSMRFVPVKSEETQGAAMVFRLPPSRLALDPADVIMLAHDGRSVPLRLISIADADARGIEAVRQDREAYDLPPGAPRPSALSQAVVFGAPDAVLLDLPQLTEDQPAHRPFAAAHAVPWPGEIAVYRSPSTDGFDLLTTFGTRARIGALVSDFYAGPTSRFDLGNVLVVDLLTGTLESVTDLTLFGGANAIAIESAPGIWEIVQAGAAELIAPGRYRLTRLLRGQRGTEGAMGNPAPAGARVVVLDTALASLPIAEADLGIPWNWRIGPANRPVSDETYVAQAFTPEGVGLRPFSVAHVEQPWRRPRTPGDLTIRWTRRSRALATDNWGAVDVLLAEETEAYEVEILDGAVVKRSLTTAATSTVYTAAAQTADWGELLGPGDKLDIRIFQLSALVGRGAPKPVTLSF